MTTPLGSRRNPIIIVGEAGPRKRPADPGPEQSSRKWPTYFGGESSQKRPMKVKEEPNPPKELIDAGPEQSSRKRQINFGGESSQKRPMKVKEEPTPKKELDSEAEQSSRRGSTKPDVEEHHPPSETFLFMYSRSSELVLSTVLHDEQVKERVMALVNGLRDTETVDNNRRWEQDLIEDVVGTREQMDKIQREHAKEISDLKARLRATEEQVETMDSGQRDWERSPSADSTGTAEKITEIRTAYFKSLYDLRADHRVKENALTEELNRALEQVEKMKREHLEKESDLIAQLGAAKKKVETMESSQQEKDNKYLPVQRFLEVRLSSANGTIRTMRCEDRKMKRECRERENRLQWELAEARKQTSTEEQRLKELSKERDEANRKIEKMELEYWEREEKMKMEMDEAQKRTVAMEGRHQEILNDARCQIESLVLQRQELQNILRAQAEITLRAIGNQGNIGWM